MSEVMTNAPTPQQARLTGNRNAQAKYLQGATSDTGDIRQKAQQPQGQEKAMGAGPQPAPGQAGAQGNPHAEFAPSSKPLDAHGRRAIERRINHAAQAGGRTSRQQLQYEAVQLQGLHKQANEKLISGSGLTSASVLDWASELGWTSARLRDVQNILNDSPKDTAKPRVETGSPTQERVRRDLALVTSTAGTVAKVASDDALRTLAKQAPTRYAFAELVIKHSGDAAYRGMLAREAPGFRLDHTVTQISRHLVEGDTDGALKTLKMNMDAVQRDAPEQRQAIYEITGKPFTQAFFEHQIKQMAQGLALPQQADRVGKRLLEWSEVAPPEVAGTILDAVHAQFPLLVRKSFSQTGDAAHANTLYQGLSRMVEVADSRGGEQAAAKAAGWVLGDRPGGVIENLRLSGKISPFLEAPRGQIDAKRLAGAARAAVAKGDEALSVALLNQLPTARKEESFAKSIASNDRSVTGSVGRVHGALSTAVAAGRRDRLEAEALAQYRAFQKNAGKNVRQHFNGLQGQQLFSKGEALPQGARLRNLAGSVLGFRPQDPQAVTAAGEPRDWYTGKVSDAAGLSVGEREAAEAQAATERGTVDLATKWISRAATKVGVKTAGPDARIKVIDTLYVSREHGVQTRPLLEVSNRRTGQSSLVDISAAKFAAAEPDAHPPWQYADLKDFQDNNLLSEHGTLYIRSADVRGNVKRADAPTPEGVEALNASVTTTREKVDKWGDRIATGVALAGSAALFVGSGGAATPLIAGAWTAVGAGMGWGAYRSVGELDKMHDHGQSLSLNNPQARTAWIGLVATAAGGASMGLGKVAAPLLRAGAAATTGEQAALGNGLSLAGHGAAMSSAASGVGAVAAGGYLTADQAVALIRHGGEMSAGEKAKAWMLLGLGAADVSVGGLGARQALTTARGPAATSDDVSSTGPENGADSPRPPRLPSRDGKASHEPLLLLGDGGAGVYYRGGRTYFVDSPGARPKPFNSAIGKEIGGGMEKHVFQLGDNWALGVFSMRGPSSSQAEPELLGKLRNIFDSYQPGYGNRYVAANYGPLALEDGSMGVISPRYAAGSKDSVFRIVHLLNRNTVDDLATIKKVLAETGTRVQDLQFLIDPDGHLMVADPLNVVKQDAQSPTMPGFIDKIEEEERLLGNVVSAKEAILLLSWGGPLIYSGSHGQLLSREEKAAEEQR